MNGWKVLTFGLSVGCNHLSLPKTISQNKIIDNFRMTFSFFYNYGYINVFIYRCPMNALFINFPATSKTMMTSSNGPLCGDITGPGEFPVERPVTRSFDVFFRLCLNRRLSKQPRGWWFETPGWSLWLHLMREHLWTQFPFPVEMRSRIFSNSLAKTAFY